MTIHREAIEHFLTALNFQATAQQSHDDKTKISQQNVMSDSIWSTLRLVLTLLERTELYTFVDNRNLTALNSEFMSNKQPNPTADN